MRMTDVLTDTRMKSSQDQRLSTYWVLCRTQHNTEHVNEQEENVATFKQSKKKKKDENSLSSQDHFLLPFLLLDTT